jgi:predicted P-loop ATPase
MKLTREDLAMLERSWVSRKIAEAAGIFRAASIEARDLVGRKGGGDFSGLIFVYRWPGSDQVVLHRLRLDNPPVDSASGKPQYKYLSAPGARNRLYFPPCAAALIEDAKLPVVITEGEKKCLALWRAAQESGNGAGQPAFLPIAVSGVWNWRGTVGIATNSKGERIPEKGVLPDFSRIAWRGRKVTVVFDANIASNDSIRAARRELARELTLRGAEVWLADLPAAAGVNGIDDFLALAGLAKALDVLRRAVRYEWRDELIHSDKGKILGILANAIAALRSAPEWCGALAFDDFSFCVTATRSTPWGRGGTWTEQDDRLLADWLQHRGIRVSDLDAGKAAETVARERSFHPIRAYLESIKWDKVSRLDDWLTLYLGVEPSDLTRAFAAKWMISAVARIFEPGCKADHCLIAEGPQGALKSTAFRILAQPWFTDDIADLGTKNAALATIGAWIIELPELDAMTRAELTRVKAFMSRSTDRFRPPYGRRLIESPRQCVFAGTVNHSEYLRDETGGRRFWPVEVGRIDVDSLRRDRDQLWSEAVARYRKGEHWWLETVELNASAAGEQDARYQADAWESLIMAWVEGKIGVTTGEVLKTALEKPVGTWNRADETRVGTILRRMGWKPRNNGRPRIYERPPQPTQPTTNLG